MSKKPIVAKVDDKLHRTVKMKAVKENKTITQVVRELLEKWVEGDDNTENDSERT